MPDQPKPGTRAWAPRECERLDYDPLKRYESEVAILAGYRKGLEEAHRSCPGCGGISPKLMGCGDELCMAIRDLLAAVED